MPDSILTPIRITHVKDFKQAELGRIETWPLLPRP